MATVVPTLFIGLLISLLYATIWADRTRAVDRTALPPTEREDALQRAPCLFDFAHAVVSVGGRVHVGYFSSQTDSLFERRDIRERVVDPRAPGEPVERDEVGRRAPVGLRPRSAFGAR